MVEARDDRNHAALDIYRAEVLRWNSQINLVSRRDTAAQLDALIHQCEAAWAALDGAHPDLLADSLLYCDLGAGGGLPGVVWHARLQARGVSGATWLVEPRDKRAWFLQRLGRMLGLAPYHVAAARWGEVEAAATARAALISLKALRLTDPEVLAGLTALGRGAATIPERVVIVRFHPGDTAWGPELGDVLGVPAPGRTIGPWTAVGGSVLPVAGGDYPPVALVTSRYEVGPS